MSCDLWYNGEMDEKKFFASLEDKTVEQLYEKLHHHSHKATPAWKRVAIRRAIARLEPRPQSWVMGLEEREAELKHSSDESSKELVDQAFQRLDGVMTSAPTKLRVKV